MAVGVVRGGVAMWAHLDPGETLVWYAEEHGELVIIIFLLVYGLLIVIVGPLEFGSSR